MALRVFRRLRDLLDVDWDNIGDGDALVRDGDTITGGTAGGGGAPSGPAGGVLSGTYPNPGFAADMATQAELDGHVNDTSGAHAASAISADSTTLVGVGTDVQAVLEELDNSIADHLADTTDAHDASAISIVDAGSHYTSTDVEGALQEAAAAVGSIPTVEAATHAASSKSTPVDNDEIPLADSAASYALKKLTWANLKATAKAYFDTLYAEVTHTHAASDITSGTIAQARLGSGSAGAGSLFLADDQTYKAPSATVSVTYDARSSNTILGTADRGKVIAATAAYTQTLTAAATLGAGWYCDIVNATQDGTTVLIVDPNSTETIDGLGTITMYSGERRRIICDGSNFKSVLIEGGFAKFTPGSSSFVVPAGISECDVVCIGSGGQGGGGFQGAAGGGGSGGGGGAVTRALIRSEDLGLPGTSITVTVGTGGSGSGAAGSPGSDGANGAATTFGTLLTAGGGGGGKGGASAVGSAGGGGGSFANTAATSTAGSPSSATATGGAAGTGGNASSAGNNSEFGGAGGGGTQSSNQGRGGGSSMYGGPGGGGGGASSAAGGAGGSTQSYTAGTAGGGGSGGASPQKGADGVFTGPYCGSGGAGGGGTGTAGVTAGAGGVGSIGAGGGGGGAGVNATSIGGAGGAGGPGECRVWYR